MLYRVTRQALCRQVVEVEAESIDEAVRLVENAFSEDGKFRSVGQWERVKISNPRVLAVEVTNGQ